MKDIILDQKKQLEERGYKGFTLMEMLIVIAIIAILIAIAIPVFTAQLEKAREATDAANIRSKYAEIMVKALDGEDAPTDTVKMVQQQSDWQDTAIKDGLAAVFPNSVDNLSSVAKDSTATITWVPGSGSTEGHATISFS